MTFASGTALPLLLGHGHGGRHVVDSGRDALTRGNSDHLPEHLNRRCDQAAGGTGRGGHQADQARTPSEYDLREHESRVVDGPSDRDYGHVGRYRTIGRREPGCQRLGGSVRAVGDQGDASYRSRNVSGGVNGADAEGTQVSRGGRPDLLPHSGRMVAEEVGEELRTGRDLETNLVAGIINCAEDSCRGPRNPGVAGASGITLEGWSRRYQWPEVATVPPGLTANGISFGKPCAARLTKPVASVHTNGAVSVGNAPPVVDQPTARPWSSIPAVQERSSREGRRGQ